MVKFTNGCFSASSVKHQQLNSSDASTSSTNHVVEAYEKGTLSLGFSGGGFLLPYFCGVVARLQASGVLRPGRTHVAGTSAGSLMAAAVTAGIPAQKVLAGLLQGAADCRVHGVPRRLAHVLRTQLEDLLEPDAHVTCSGRTHVFITRMFPRPRTLTTSHFSSRDDLISALLASCHIPGLSDGRITTDFRGRSVMDGGLLALIPRPPDSHPSSVIKISAIPRSHIPKLPLFNKKESLAGLAIAPDMFAPWPWSFKQTVEWTMGPGPDEFMQELVTRGEADASAWLAHSGLAAHLGLEKPAAQVPTLLAALSETGASASSGEEEREGEAAVAGISSTRPAGAVLQQAAAAHVVGSHHAVGSSRHAAGMRAVHTAAPGQVVVVEA